MRLLNSSIESLSRYFRLENEIQNRNGSLVLVSKSYFKDKCIFTHELPLDEIIQEAKKQILEEISD